MMCHYCHVIYGTLLYPESSLTNYICDNKKLFEVLHHTLWWFSFNGKLCVQAGCRPWQKRVVQFEVPASTEPKWWFHTAQLNFALIEWNWNRHSLFGLGEDCPVLPCICTHIAWNKDHRRELDQGLWNEYDLLTGYLSIHSQLHDHFPNELMKSSPKDPSIFGVGWKGRMLFSHATWQIVLQGFYLYRSHLAGRVESSQFPCCLPEA